MYVKDFLGEERVNEEALSIYLYYNVVRDIKEKKTNLIIGETLSILQLGSRT